MSHSTLARRVCVAAMAAAIATAGISTSASAASADLDYTCTLFTIDDEIDPEEFPEGLRKALDLAKAGDLSALEELGDLDTDAAPFADVEGLALTASFDSAIKDGATAGVGDDVELSPLTAQLTLPAATVAAMGDFDFDFTFGAAGLFAGVDRIDEPNDAFFEFEELDYDGTTLTAAGTGEAEPFTTVGTGAHRYLAGDLEMFFTDGEAFVGLECSLDEGQDNAIDTITAVAATPNPTPTPTPSAPEPERPDVVQTDAAQPQSPVLPALALGLGTLTLVGAGAYAGQRRRGH